MFAGSSDRAEGVFYSILTSGFAEL